MVNFPSDCFPPGLVIIRTIDNLISELLQFRAVHDGQTAAGGGCSSSWETWLKAQRYTWSHSVHVPRVYLGKVGLTYWDRSGRLVAFMYPPPCWRAAPKWSSSFFLPSLFCLLSAALRAPSLFQPSASKAERRNAEIVRNSRPRIFGGGLLDSEKINVYWENLSRVGKFFLRYIISLSSRTERLRGYREQWMLRNMRMLCEYDIIGGKVCNAKQR